MIYLAWFIFAFSVLQLLVACVNLFFRQSFPMKDTEFNGLVSVLIPARNEEKNIGTLLKDLKNQNYQNIEVFVFNDLSTDKTAEIVTEMAKTDQRIKLLNSENLPDGWLGKNYACHCLSQHAKGRYFLFLDADVRIRGNILINVLKRSEKYKLDLLSVFPRQIMNNIGEWLTVPVMNYILLTLLPLILVRKSKYPSLAAANGQFMLFDASVYKNTLPHEKMKAEKVEDIEIARFFKQIKLKTACLAGDTNISCRMYQGYSEAVNGFSKNVTHFFGNSLLVAILFWLITTFGFVAIWIVLPIEILYIYLTIIILIRILISLVSNQNPVKNLIFLMPQQISMGVFIYQAVINKFKKQHQWKGRNILSLAF